MTYTNHMALRLRDVSLVPLVGPRMKEKLAARGIRRIWDLAAASSDCLREIPGVGRSTAERLIVNARAIREGICILLDPSALHFPCGAPSLFLDLEGTDPAGEQEGLEQVDYLIGLLIEDTDGVRYRPFMAWRIDEEARMFREFVDFVTMLDDAVIYHWHNYERWHLKKLADRHGFAEFVEKRIFPRMVDLHRVATRAFAFPTPTNGLKDIAGHLGFRWRHDDVNASMRSPGICGHRGSPASGGTSSRPLSSTTRTTAWPRSSSKTGFSRRQAGPHRDRDGKSLYAVTVVVVG